MKKSTSSLSYKGLSISQAQSISNLCNQRAKEIGNTITNVNNYSKHVKIDEEEAKCILKARKLPQTIVELLIEKAKLHACQAFLMENLKEKDRLIRETKDSILNPFDTIKIPVKPLMKTVDLRNLIDVSEDWGWECLTAREYNEYLEAEAYASHIGQYIHKDGVLDKLRKELPTIPDIEWMHIHDGTKSPVDITVHHKSEELLTIHEDLAKLHREYEQRVNYFKAKVKNLVTAENSRIAKIRNDKSNIVKAENDKMLNQYKHELELLNQEANKMLQEYEVERQKNIATYAALKIDVDPRFQNVVDDFLKKLSDFK